MKLRITIEVLEGPDPKSEGSFLPVRVFEQSTGYVMNIDGALSNRNRMVVFETHATAYAGTQIGLGYDVVTSHAR